MTNFRILLILSHVCESITVQNFKFSTAHVKFHQIVTLILCLLKVYKISAEKSIAELCLMTVKSHVKFEKTLICRFKNDKNFENFELST